MNPRLLRTAAARCKTAAGILLAAAALCSAAARADDTAPAQKPDQTQDLALFANGDTLRGSMAGWDKAGLRWQTVYGQKVIVTTKFLREIQLRPRQPPANAAKFIWSVLLANGDVLPGALVSMDDKILVLDTWYAGKLSIPRPLITAIGKAGFPYQGPTGLDGWTLTPADEPGWTYAGGAFTTSVDAAIGRPIRFPTRTQIGFDVAPNGSGFDVYLNFDPAGKIGRSYLFEIEFGNGAVYTSLFQYDSGVKLRVGQVAAFEDKDLVLNPPLLQGDFGLGWQGGNTVSISATPAAPPTLPKKLHFEIRIDKKAGTLGFSVNGKQVRQDPGLADLARMGGGLVFTPGNSIRGMPLVISGIQVGVWGGDPAAGRAAPGPDDEGVDLASGDFAQGKIAGIAGGKLNIVTSGSSSAIPLDQVGGVCLAGPAPGPQPPPAIPAARAFLTGGGIVQLEIESLADGRAAVLSPDFDRAVFKADAFQKLEFNFDKAGDAPQQ